VKLICIYSKKQHSSDKRKKSNIADLGIVAHSVIPVLRRLWKEDHKFKATLSYMSSKPFWAT
jgi:hypothetical protein